MKTPNDQLISNLARVYLSMHRRIDRAMTEQGASLARTKLLLYIQDHAGKARAADIAELFDQAPRTVTEALDALEREGLIVRTPDPNDRRVKRLATTDVGDRAIKATEPLRRQLVDEIFGVLDASESDSLGRALQKLLEALPVA